MKSATIGLTEDTRIPKEQREAIAAFKLAQKRKDIMKYLLTSIFLMLFLAKMTFDFLLQNLLIAHSAENLRTAFILGLTQIIVVGFAAFSVVYKLLTTGKIGKL
jgi:hypothetical protein